MHRSLVARDTVKSAPERFRGGLHHDRTTVQPNEIRAERSNDPTKLRAKSTNAPALGVRWGLRDKRWIAPVRGRTSGRQGRSWCLSGNSVCDLTCGIELLSIPRSSDRAVVDRVHRQSRCDTRQLRRARCYREGGVPVRPAGGGGTGSPTHRTVRRASSIARRSA